MVLLNKLKNTRIACFPQHLVLLRYRKLSYVDWKSELKKWRWNEKFLHERTQSGKNLPLNRKFVKC